VADYGECHTGGRLWEQPNGRDSKARDGLPRKERCRQREAANYAQQDGGAEPRRELIGGKSDETDCANRASDKHPIAERNLGESDGWRAVV